MKTQNPISASGNSAGGQNVAGYVGEINFFCDGILRPNHVWADGSPIDAEQWPELAAYAARAGWDQNDDGQYLTPDIRGRMLINRSDKHAVNTQGGSETHTIVTSELPTNALSTNMGGAHGKAGSIAEAAVAVLGAGDGTWSPIIKMNDGTQIPGNYMNPYHTVTMQIRAKVDKIIAMAPVEPDYGTWETYSNGGYTIKYNMRLKTMTLSGKLAVARNSIPVGFVYMTDIPEDIRPTNPVEIYNCFPFYNGTSLKIATVLINPDGTIKNNENLPGTAGSTLAAMDFTTCMDGWNDNL